MDESHRQRGALLLLGVAYFVVGITFAALAGSASSNQMRVTWRLAAWLISATMFAAHIGYAHVRLRRVTATTALYAATAVGLGAFALAVAATIRGQASGASHQSARALALVLWPVLTAVPAFVVALSATTLLALRRRGV